MELRNFASIFVVLLALIVSPIRSSQKLRIVSWNVADNKWMSGGFTQEALDAVLGITDGKNLADIYVVGLQEQCWKCNEKNFGQILRKFEKRLERHGDYEALGMEGTRKSASCELECATLGNHGTTAVVVLARRGVVVETVFNRVLKECSSSTPTNDEKGVAFARLKLSNKRSICVASAHLDSRKPKLRRRCLKNFFGAAEQMVDWSSCSSKFIVGDFNTRTGDKKPKSKDGIHGLSTSVIRALKRKDELLGYAPYGADSSWSDNMMKYINICQPDTYKELPLNFAPTYKQNEGGFCNYALPCYRADRPISWTDRIIYTGAVGISYDSIEKFQTSDHFPVVAEFQV